MGPVLMGWQAVRLRPARQATAVEACVLMAVLGLAGCTGTQTATPPPAEPSKTYVKLPAVPGGLSISTTDLITDGRFAKVRGHVMNPHAQDVDGIRYLVRVETRGGQPRTLDRFQFETTERLPPGEETMMRLNVESMYFGTSNQLSIIALPKQLGGQPVPLPDDWK